jgi:hypothetical protein
VAEQGCLLSSYPDKIGIGGSNPPLSASVLFSMGWIPSLSISYDFPQRRYLEKEEILWPAPFRSTNIARPTRAWGLAAEIIPAQLDACL